MGAYLIDNPPARSQYAARTSWAKSKITGCTVLHSSEFPAGSKVLDLAEFIRRRADPGSYHDICDVHGGALTLIPYRLGAYHDGTGSNGWATSISFNLRTIDWRKLTTQQRRSILMAGARKFAEQQGWRRANGHPLTELRRITRAQSEAGLSGFITHGDRDPGRRSDPGADFPWAEWLACCREALGGVSTGSIPAPKPAPRQEDFLMALSDIQQARAAEQIDALWKALTQPVIVGETLAASQRRLVNTTAATHVEVAGLRETVKQLAGQRPDGDEIVRRVEEAIASAVVQVEVTFGGQPPAA